MPQTHGITTETVSNFLLDSGAVYLNYGLTNERLLGATRGGSTFTVEQEIKEIEIDGAKGLVKGARRVISVTSRITCNLIEITATNIQQALAGTTSSEVMADGSTPATAGTGTHTSIERIGNVTDADFVDNVAIVASVSGSGENFIGVVKNALADGNLEFSLEDKEEGVIELQFTGHFDPADLDSEPWEIRFPTA